MTGKTSQPEKPGIILGIDYGTKRMGIAVGQLMTGTATPLKALPAKDGVPQCHLLELVIAQWRPIKIVVGRPVHLDGAVSEMTKKAERFARQVAGRYDLTCLIADERLSTYEAKSLIRDVAPKADKDSLSACLILEHWMRENNKQTP